MRKYELIIEDSKGQELELLATGSREELEEARAEMLDQEDELGYPGEWLKVQRG